MEIGKKIAERMQNLGLSQRELARRSETLTQATISKYIQGKNKPTYDNLLILSKLLNVPVSWFFPEEPSVPQTRRSIILNTLQVADEIVFPSVSGKFSRGGVLVIGHYLPMQVYTPPTQGGLQGIIANFYSLIFNPLVQGLPGSRFRGAIAVECKPTEDGWVFRLRDGVRFHNGKPLSIEDVFWSYDQYLLHTPDEPQIEGVKVLDSSFIQICLKVPCRLDELRMPYIVPYGMSDKPEAWVGTGPFQPMEIRPGFWRLRKNPHYFFSPPYLDEVQIREYPNIRALEKALVDGEVNFAFEINCPGEGFVTKPESFGMRYHLHFMLQDELTRHPLFRKAVALALDREHLAEAIGLKAPLYSVGPFDYFVDDRTEKPPIPDLDTARQLLKGVPKLTNRAFRIKFYLNAPQTKPLAEAIVSQLKRVGINAEIGDPPHALLLVRPISLPSLELNMWQTKRPENINGYSNPEVDRRIETYQHEQMTNVQLLELRRLIQADLPDIPLFYHEIPITYVEALRAVEDHVVLGSGMNTIHTWYLESPKQAKIDQMSRTSASA